MMNINIIKNIPNLNEYCLTYIFEKIKLEHKKNTLWMEFGVGSGNTINYISQFTNEIVYGFDSFEGLPEKWRDGFEKGMFGRNGNLPEVRENVKLIKGWFDETLDSFLKSNNKKISFLHLDADLYSSTKYVLDKLVENKKISDGCIILFDELLNFPGFLGETSELRALCEWVEENPNIEWEWIGMNGVIGMNNYEYEQACLKINRIN